MVQRPLPDDRPLPSAPPPELLGPGGSHSQGRTQGEMLQGLAWLSARGVAGGLVGVALHALVGDEQVDSSWARSFARGAAAGAGLAGAEVGACKALAAWRLQAVRRRCDAVHPSLLHYQRWQERSGAALSAGGAGKGAPAAGVWEQGILSIRAGLPADSWDEFASGVKQGSHAAQGDLERVHAIAGWWPSLVYSSERRKARTLLVDVRASRELGWQSVDFCRRFGALIEVAEAVARHPLHDHHRQRQHGKGGSTNAEIVYRSGGESLFPFLAMERRIVASALPAKLTGLDDRPELTRATTVAEARELSQFSAEFLAGLRNDPELRRERRDEVMHARQEEALAVEKEALTVEKSKLAAALAAAEMLREKTEAVRGCSKALEAVSQAMLQPQTLQGQPLPPAAHGAGSGSGGVVQAFAVGQQPHPDDVLQSLRSLIRRAERTCELR